MADPPGVTSNGLDPVLRAPGPENLCHRQTEVLILIARGKYRKQIAQVLGLSENTVKDYVEHLHEKLELRNDALLASYAIHHNLVPKP